MGTKSTIKIHESETSGFGVYLIKVRDISNDFTEKIRYAHRDDHYIFYVQEEGQTELMIDFQTYRMKGKMLFFVCPGQVHDYIRQSRSKGYFIFVEPAYLRSGYRNVFEENQNLQQIIPVGGDALFLTSVPYLNEVIKEQTGYPVSYWIQQEILQEAKRLLYYTPMNSKEIAFSLGYDDYAYFPRFFKKNVGVTPLGFRNNCLDLSNHHA